MPCRMAGLMKNRSSSGWATTLTDEVVQPAADAGDAMEVVAAAAAAATSPASRRRRPGDGRRTLRMVRSVDDRSREPVTSHPFLDMCGARTGMREQVPGGRP